MFYKKGAMFGLDARIALAIFGALSVISGAALYSAIQNSKATALYVQLSELGKAWESYYIDTGSILPQVSTNASDDSFYVLKSFDLVNNSSGISNWNGPYFSGTVAPGDSNQIDSPTYRRHHVVVFTDSNVWGDSDSWTTDKCTTGKKCAIFVNIDGIDSDSLAIKIDELHDGGNGSNEGNFKWHTHNSGTQYAYYLKIAPTANLHD